MTETHTKTRAAIAAEVGTAPWSLLENHAHNDRLIIIDGDLELIDAALAIANNESDAVTRWIASGALTKPSLERWTAYRAAEMVRFQFVIVQPFVVAKLIDV